MKLHTRHVQYLIRAIVVLIACNAVAFVGAKLDLRDGMTIAASIVISFVAQLVLTGPIFEGYMRWNARRTMLNRKNGKA